MAIKYRSPIPPALWKSENCKKGTLKEKCETTRGQISCIYPHYISCKCHITGYLPLEIELVVISQKMQNSESNGGGYRNYGSQNLDPSY